MCTIPPPPPPPTPPNVTTSTKVPMPTNGDLDELYIDPDICTWAAEYPEIRAACFKSGICLDKPPFIYKYRYFQSILQVGPTCGLVAMSMLVNRGATINELLNITKIEGFSNNGEMFSCKHMVELSKIAHSFAGIANIKCTLEQGGLFSSETVERLVNGAVLLVPYDADCNHSPCLRKGHTAHWAIICGVIVINDPEDKYDSDPKNIYVLCKHGKSKHLAAWNLYQLAQSNKNLWEFCPKKGADGLVYVLPEGGIGGNDGLRDQFLIFEGY